MNWISSINLLKKLHKSQPFLTTTHLFKWLIQSKSTIKDPFIQNKSNSWDPLRDQYLNYNNADFFGFVIVHEYNIYAMTVSFKRTTS